MSANDMIVETFANVFDAIADTPEEAAELKARADQMLGIREQVKLWEVPRGEAAKRLGLTGPLDDLLRVKFDRFSLDDLMTAATAAGIEQPTPRKSSWDDLRGMVKGNGKRFTIEEIKDNDAIADATAAAGMAGMHDHGRD
ncbi:XRE family transcriptional regulator (plasmid) [Sphingobium yanoikuyae]|uniref:XRE family transcriptional regulator n=1 Tax=Sphingobium yanoikuyae TaxID=13690 RepID=A0A6M4GG34_SPHYA|nr:XRE family transcriptional regulator [Sphingobium yanoikuyae]QJR06209.1 XRE family transcriptional regulator [Sphingobium yanoikuyae]